MLPPATRQRYREPETSFSKRWIVHPLAGKVSSVIEISEEEERKEVRRKRSKE